MFLIQENSIRFLLCCRLQGVDLTWKLPSKIAPSSMVEGLSFSGNFLKGFHSCIPYFCNEDYLDNFWQKLVRVILEIEGSNQQIHKKAVFLYKKLSKGSSDLSNLNIHSILILLLMKNFLKNKNWLRAIFKSQMQFWHRTPSS